MDKIKTITKALFVGMGISFLFKVFTYSYFGVLHIILPLTIACIIFYFFVFRSEKIFNLFFKNSPKENSTNEFQIKCLSISVVFFAVLSLTTSSFHFMQAIPAILNIPEVIIDSIVFRDSLMINLPFAKESLIAILKLLLFSFNIYLLLGTQHFIKLLMNLEEKQNVQL